MRLLLICSQIIVQNNIPKSSNPADKRTTMFLSSDELAFLDEMGYLTRTNRTQYLRSIIREKMESIDKGAV